MTDAPVLLWLNRSLRLGDNPAMKAAAESGHPVIPVYVLDDVTPSIRRAGGASRWWLAGSLKALAADLEDLGTRLILRKGRVDEVLKRLAEETGAQGIYWNTDFTPPGRSAEERLKSGTESSGLTCKRFNGQLLWEPGRVLNKSGDPFKVFTPFWKAARQQGGIAEAKAKPKHLQAPKVWPESDDMDGWNLRPTKPDWAAGLRDRWTPGETAAIDHLHTFIDEALNAYADKRDLPAVKGTSRLSPHLAFGEISPRQIWQAVITRLPEAGEPFLRELAWREFSYHLLDQFPALPNENYKSDFDAFPWQENDEHLKAWQRGRTGYPLVDAGMRELWHTGWMHGRVRMVAASFLIKHLLQPWQAGEAWFWDTLVDADLANNAASWQWVAGSGADAAPFFRIFNPITQGEKFDPSGAYIRRWVPELADLPDQYLNRPWEAPTGVLLEAGVTLGKTYPHPVVDHKVARERALTAFKSLKPANAA